MICRFRFVLEVLRVQSLTYVNFRREPAVIKHKYEYLHSPFFNFMFTYLFTIKCLYCLISLSFIYGVSVHISILSHGNNNFCMPALYYYPQLKKRGEVEIKLSFQNLYQICSWVFPAQFLLEKVSIKKHTLKHLLSIVKCSNTPWIIGICFVVCKTHNTHHH